MTVTVEFRTGVADTLAYACRWLVKAMRSGTCTRVIGMADDLHALDRALWVNDPLEFIPHRWAALQTAAGQAAAPSVATPIWLGHGATAVDAPQLLLNLGAEPPPDATAYQRIVELVGTSAGDIQAGRLRWAAYKRMGLEPAHRVC